MYHAMFIHRIHWPHSSSPAFAVQISICLTDVNIYFKKCILYFNNYVC